MQKTKKEKPLKFNIIGVNGLQITKLNVKKESPLIRGENNPFKWGDVTPDFSKIPGTVKAFNRIAWNIIGTP